MGRKSAIKVFCAVKYAVASVLLKDIEFACRRKKYNGSGTYATVFERLHFNAKKTSE